MFQRFCCDVSALFASVMLAFSRFATFAAPAIAGNAVPSDESADVRLDPGVTLDGFTAEGLGSAPVAPATPLAAPTAC